MTLSSQSNPNFNSPRTPTAPQTREGARHRRLARKRGTAKACVATGNTQLKVHHKLLSDPGMRYADPGMRYADLGPNYYDRQRNIRRQIAHHVGRLGSLGFEVTLCLPEAGPDETSPAQATRSIPRSQRPDQPR
jgi:hypothetical protein